MMVPEIEKIWPHWHIDGEPIGSGSYGTVYKIRRRSEFGEDFFAALKVIHIPRNESELYAYRSQAMDDETIRSFYRGQMESLCREISVMESLKTADNIVSIEDYAVEKEKNGIGWTIYIRMELLKSLYLYQKEKKFTREDILKMGCDICNALESCEKNRIIHRDIKPANIFVNKFGSFKLGDFGIAKELGSSGAAYSVAGTPAFEAPEVTKGEGYNQTADIYSFGMVLYVCLNHGRQPFLPPYPEPVTPQSNAEAQRKRMTGEIFPLPDEADERLGNVIRKACSYDPGKRYQSAVDFRRDLMRYRERYSDSFPEDGEQTTRRIRVPAGSEGETKRKDTESTIREIYFPIPETSDETERTTHGSDIETIHADPLPQNPSSGKRKKKVILFLGIAAVFFLAGMLIRTKIVKNDTGSDSVESSETEITSEKAKLVLDSNVILKGDTTAVYYEYNGLQQNYGDNLTFESSDSSVATVSYDSSVKQTLVTGVSEGTATITGIRNGISGKKSIIVADVDEDSGVSISSSVKKLDLLSDSESGISLELKVRGDLTDQIVANVYFTKGLNLDIEGGFEGEVLSLTIKDRASVVQSGTLTVLVSDNNEQKHVLAKTEIPVTVEF